MHGAISAFQSGVPAISLSYSVKYKGVIGNSLNLPELIVETKKNTFLEDIDKVNELISEVIQKREKIILNIKKNVKIVKKDAYLQIEEISKSIKVSKQS